MQQDLVSYYNDRAKEYEKVYWNPAEQDDLLAATNLFQAVFAQKKVLEIACGTGYWTERIAQTATSLHATDINASVLEIAQKRRSGNNLSFSMADIYSLPTGPKYEGLFGGFIWSHILLQDLDRFLDQCKNVLLPGADLVFIDSNPVEGTNHDRREITQTDEQGNTYQTRSLENGATHVVLKNFPGREFLDQKLSRIAGDIQHVNLEHYWIVCCRLGE